MYVNGPVIRGQFTLQRLFTEGLFGNHHPGEAASCQRDIELHLSQGNWGVLHKHLPGFRVNTQVVQLQFAGIRRFRQLCVECDPPQQGLQSGQAARGGLKGLGR